MNRIVAALYYLSIVVAMIAIFYAFLIFTGLLFSAHGQEGPTVNVEPPMYFPDASNAVPTIRRTWYPKTNVNEPPASGFIERRSAPVPIPPLPNRITYRTVATNASTGERIVVTVERPSEPPPLPQSRYMTNVFEVMCTRCRVTAQRVPKRVEEVGVMTVPEGDELELTLYFVCCSREFRAKSKVFIETPVARLIH